MSSNTDQPVIVIRPSLRASVDPHLRDSAYELLGELKADGHDAKLEFRNPGQFSAQNSLETIAIFIAGAVSTKLLEYTVERILVNTKSWLKKRFAKDKATGAQYVTIYGPDNKPLKNVLAKNADQILDITPHRDPD